MFQDITQREITMPFNVHSWKLDGKLTNIACHQTSKITRDTTYKAGNVVEPHLPDHLLGISGSHFNTFQLTNNHHH